MFRSQQQQKQQQQVSGKDRRTGGRFRVGGGSGGGGRRQQHQQPDSNNSGRSTSTVTGRKANQQQHHQLSPLKENVPSQPRTVTVARATNLRQQQPDNQRPSPQQRRSTMGNPSATSFSQAELKELTDSFRLFDVNGTGSITVRDLRDVLTTLQQEQAEEEQQDQHQSTTISQYHYPHLDALLERLAYLGGDDDDDGDDMTLTLDDYLQLMASTSVAASAPTSDHDAMPAIFRLFDLDGKGYISVDDLQRVAVELGELEMTREELEEMIRRGAAMKDTEDGGQHEQQQEQGQSSGQVRLEDFQRIMHTNFSIPQVRREQQRQQQQHSTS